jgi:hypothetical protein
VVEVVSMVATWGSVTGGATVVLDEVVDAAGRRAACRESPPAEQATSAPRTAKTANRRTTGESIRGGMPVKAVGVNWSDGADR